MAIPLYAQVARKLSAAIASGRFPVGSLLPTELELCDQYGTSRPTVRLALQELQAMGLVSRKKRLGTSVDSATPQAGYSQAVASLEDLVQLAEDQMRILRKAERVVLSRAAAKQLGVLPGTRWIRLELLRLPGDGNEEEPAGWTETYIDADYTDIPKLLRKQPKILVSSLIESHYGRRVAEVEQTIRAVPLAPDLAELLHAEPGSPALRIMRRYLDQANEAFEIAITIHPGERMSVSTRLRRDRP
jgi:DNA-binding GntR family transcriptional regulator